MDGNLASTGANGHAIFGGASSATTAVGLTLTASALV
jgi:hypothetical protein